MPIIEPPIVAIYPYEPKEGESPTTITVPVTPVYTTDRVVVVPDDQDVVLDLPNNFVAMSVNDYLLRRTCRNCKFWDGNGEEGECKKIGHETVQFLAHLSDPSTLFTKADFGCIQFEVKDAE